MQYDLKEYSDKYIVGYAKFSDMKLTCLDEGLAVGEMPVTENHTNPFHTVHGGAIFALADSIGGIACRTLGTVPTTCSSTITYLRPTFNCEKIIAAARVIKNGANTIVTDIVITNDKGIEVSRVLATYFNLGMEKGTL